MYLQTQKYKLCEQTDNIFKSMWFITQMLPKKAGVHVKLFAEKHIMMTLDKYICNSSTKSSGNNNSE